jgi:hypothetical protein
MPLAPNMMTGFSIFLIYLHKANDSLTLMKAIKYLRVIEGV